jgi:hypothetical protein
LNTKTGNGPSPFLGYAINASIVTGDFLYDPSFKLINSFGKGPELYEGICTILAPLKYFHKVNNCDVPANEGLAINKQIRIINIFFILKDKH